MRTFLDYTNELLDCFSNDINSAIKSLDEFIKKIPVSHFAKKIDFTAKYDNQINGIVIFKTYDKDNFEILIKSSDTSYCEAVFLNAFNQYFDLDTRISKITKIEPDLTKPDLKPDDFYILYEFSIKPIFSISSELFDTKKNK